MANDMSRMTDKVRETAREAGDKARELASDARHRASDTATRVVEEHPLATVAAAAAAGALIGLFLPRWNVGATAGPALRRGIDAASSAARTVASAEVTRAVLDGFAHAGDRARQTAHNIAEHTPTAEDIRAGAARTVARASEAVQKARQQVARQTDSMTGGTEH